MRPSNQRKEQPAEQRRIHPSNIYIPPSILELARRHNFVVNTAKEEQQQQTLLTPPTTRQQSSSYNEFYESQNHPPTHYQQQQQQQATELHDETILLLNKLQQPHQRTMICKNTTNQQTIKHEYEEKQQNIHESELFNSSCFGSFLNATPSSSFENQDIHHQEQQHHHEQTQHYISPMMLIYRNQEENFNTHQQHYPYSQKSVRKRFVPLLLFFH